MSNIEDFRKALAKRLLEGEGVTPSLDRRAAYDNAVSSGAMATLVQKVAKQAYSITDADILAAKSAGLSEDEIFEIVVCASVGQADRQYEAAMAALQSAIGKE